MPFGILQPGRWRRQPQGPVEIDWGHPMARGLRGLFVAGAGPVELVTKKQFINLNTALAPDPKFYTTGPAGRAWQDATFDGPVYRNVPPASSGRTDQLETAAQFEVTQALLDELADGGFKHVVSTSTASQIGLGVTRVSGSLRIAYRLDGLDDLTAGGFEGVAYRLDGTSTAPVGRPITAFGLATWTTNSAPTNNEEMQVGFEGKAEASARYAVFGSGSDDISIAPIAYRDQGSSRHYRVYTMGVWGRRRSDAERLEYARNPYAFVRPRRPIIYSLPASGIPVLSGSTVIDIGQTSARPRVTITF
jgi:hypothetical protein